MRTRFLTLGLLYVHCKPHHQGLSVLGRNAHSGVGTNIHSVRLCPKHIMYTTDESKTHTVCVCARVCVCVCVCVLTGGDMGPSDAKTSVEYRDKRFSYAHEKMILSVMKGF